MEPMIEKSTDRRALEWAFGNDTGLSSKAIAMHMLGVKPSDWWGYGYPLDGDDLGRCARLLDAIPEWRDRIPEMAAHSPAWAALVEHWDELVGMYRAADKRLYERMKAVLKGPESRDKNLVQMGGGVSIRFGGSA